MNAYVFSTQVMVRALCNRVSFMCLSMKAAQMSVSEVSICRMTYSVICSHTFVYAQVSYIIVTLFTTNGSMYV